MASSLNKVQLIGRLGRDPEVRSTGTGKTVTTITVATSETYGRDADRKEKTEWHKVILWDKLGQIAGNYLKKGRQVFIEGKITYREYTDKENIKRYTTEIIAQNLVFLGSKDEGASSGGERSSYQSGNNNNFNAAEVSEQDIDNISQSMQSIGNDDDVPF